MYSSKVIHLYEYAQSWDSASYSDVIPVAYIVDVLMIGEGWTVLDQSPTEIMADNVLV
jgi:hypothetical protein